MATATGSAVVYFGDGGVFGDPPQGSHLFDWTNDTVGPEIAGTPDVHIFCSGHCLLADGRWLIGGGIGLEGQNQPHGAGGPAHDDGDQRSHLFNPRAGTWEDVSNLAWQPGGDHGGGRWYPTLVTLADGSGLAVSGHPSLSDDYPDPAARRHNNNTPELFSPASKAWTLVGGDLNAADDDYPVEYARVHVTPSGHVFFSTLARRDDAEEFQNRFYDPSTGTFVGSAFDSPHPRYDVHDPGDGGSRGTTVMLPLLPHDANQAWVLAFGAPGDNAPRINVANPDGWKQTGRATSAPDRIHVCAVLLPTGEAFFSGGVGEGTDDVQAPAVKTPEIYTPPIDWSNDFGRYTSAKGTWTTLVDDVAQAVRGYHSTALLLPDARVWTAGSTDAAGDATGPPWEQGPGHDIEIWRPPWWGSAGRPSIDLAGVRSSVGYDETFEIPLIESATIERVALTRCGSVTHAFDSDQRYVALEFKANGATIEARAPKDPGIAPPGNYLLWVIAPKTNAAPQGLPAVRAAFLRVCEQSCRIVNEHSTFSVMEAEALQEPPAQGEARFKGALFVFFEGYMPHELGNGAPTVTFRFDSLDGPVVAGMSADFTGTNVEDQAQPADVSQTWIFEYDVVFDGDLSAFSFSGTDEPVYIEAELGFYRCTGKLQLSKDPNPYMSDGAVPWLSDDLRVFTIQPGATVGDFTYQEGTSPTTFAATAIKQCNDADPAQANPFDSLPAGQQESALELEGADENGVPYYSFALARVRYRANQQTAERVKVFFRLFNTWGPAMEFDKFSTYRRHEAGPDLTESCALLGLVDAKIVSIPFFAEARVTPHDKMEDQPDPENRRDIPPAGADESFRYYGCWLDINQDEHHLPYEPITKDGPYHEPPEMGGPLKPIADYVRGAHQCLVAEIFYEPDMTDQGLSPETSDNLAQRNIAWAPVENPGDVATRTALHTFFVDPSPSDETYPYVTALGQDLPSPRRRARPDLLAIWCGGLPQGSTVTLYMPSLEVDRVFESAIRRLGPPVVEKVDDHTLRATAGELALIPLPGGIKSRIPGLLSVELPKGIANGEDYRLVVRQISGLRNQVMGTAELAIPVKHASDILPRETKTLAAMKRVLLAMRSEDDWHPVMARYVKGLEKRVRGLGGDPGAVEPAKLYPSRPRGRKPLPRSPWWRRVLRRLRRTLRAHEPV